MIYVENYATTKMNALAMEKSRIRKPVATPDGVPPKVGSNCIRNPLWLPSRVTPRAIGFHCRGKHRP